MKNHERPTVGERMSIARKIRGMTQAELALKIKVHPAQISEWEIFRPVPLHHLPALAEKLVVSIEYLMGQSDKPWPFQGADAIDVQGLTAADIELLKSIARAMAERNNPHE